MNYFKKYMYSQVSQETKILASLWTKQLTLSWYMTDSCYALEFAKPGLEDSRSMYYLQSISGKKGLHC